MIEGLVIGFFAGIGTMIGASYLGIRAAMRHPEKVGKVIIAKIMNHR